MSQQTKNEVTSKAPNMCKPKEKIGHSIGVLGHDSAYSMWSTYITPFMTDFLGLPAWVLGFLAVFGRIFDAINDFAMGFIADKTKSKHGRYRAWILRAGPLFCICMALSFVIPGDNMIVRCVYACIMYVVVDVVFTAVDIPFWSLPAAMTSNTVERGNIIATTSTMSTLISAVVAIVGPMVLVSLGGEDSASAYLLLGVIIAVFAIIMYLCSFALVREHVTPNPKQKVDFKKSLQSIYANKPLILVIISYIFAMMAAVFKSYFNYYYCSYNLGGLEYMSLLSLISGLSSIVGTILFMPISKFAGKKNTIYSSAILYTAAMSVVYFSGWQNTTILYGCNVVTGLCSGAINVCITSMFADTMEYGEWKTGQRNEGVITSTRCTAVKLVSAVGGTAVALVVGLTDYVPLAEVQSAAVLNSFHFMSTLLCAIVMILAAVPMFFYELTEKRHAEIVAELNARKANLGD